MNAENFWNECQQRCLKIQNFSHLALEVCAFKKSCRCRQSLFIFGRYQVNLSVPPPPILSKRTPLLAYCTYQRKCRLGEHRTLPFKHTISRTFLSDWEKKNNFTKTTPLEIRKHLAGKISKTIQHFDKCIVMYEYVACVVSSSMTFRQNTDRLARTAKREMKKMIGETVYEMPFIHFSFLLFRQHFLAFSSV